MPEFYACKVLFSERRQIGATVSKQNSRARFYDQQPEPYDLSDAIAEPVNRSNGTKFKYIMRISYAIA